MPPYTHQTSHEYLLNACKENNLEQINASIKKFTQHQLQEALRYRDNSGNTPLFYACMNNNLDAVVAFIGKGASKDSIVDFERNDFRRNNKNESIMDILCINGYRTILDELIQNMVGLDNFILRADDQGQTLLTYACQNQRNEIVESLVKNYDFDLNKRDNFGLKPLDYSKNPKMLILKKFFSLLPTQNSNTNFSSFLNSQIPQQDSDLKIFLHKQYHDLPSTNDSKKVKFTRLVLEELNKSEEFEPSKALDVVCEFYTNPEIVTNFSNFIRTSKGLKEKITKELLSGENPSNEAQSSKIEEKLPLELIGIIAGKILSSQKINLDQCSKLTKVCATIINSLKEPKPQNTTTNPSSTTPLNPQQNQL